MGKLDEACEGSKWNWASQFLVPCFCDISTIPGFLQERSKKKKDIVWRLNILHDSSILEDRFESAMMHCCLRCNKGGKKDRVHHG
jgi:hypothetical protein